MVRKATSQERRQNTRYPGGSRLGQGLHRHGLAHHQRLARVSEKLSKRVWQAIEQLNYFPNTHARTLVSGRSRLFGIIVENITNPFFPELIQSFEEIAVAHGYEILVSSSNSDPAVLTTCVRRMLERKVEGVAVMTFGEEEPVLDQSSFTTCHGACRIQSRRAQGQHHRPRLPHRDARRRRTPRALGHRKIGFLAGPHKLHSAITRQNDFQAAMQEANCPSRRNGSSSATTPSRAA